MSILIDADTHIIVQGITGREAVSFTRDMLDYGAKVVGGVTPSRGGRDVLGVPVYDTVRQISAGQRVDVSVLAVPAPALRDAAFEAIDAGIPLLMILTERVPRKDVMQVLELAALRGCRVIGPNSMGLIAPGKTKVGPIGGPAADAAKAFLPGPVGIMSRSGGMTTEIANLLSQHGLGQSTAISMGGDPIIGSTFADLLPLWEADGETKGLVIFGEPGGGLEAQLAQYVEAEGTRLPIVAFIAGSFMEEMPGLRFGHAGSIVEGWADTAAEKMRILRQAGILVAEDFSQIPSLLLTAMKQADSA
ncbi:MAG: succinate--CoA ligase subunit alpha [Dehalococcoidia bacterium]